MVPRDSDSDNDDVEYIGAIIIFVIIIIITYVILSIIEKLFIDTKC